MEEEGLVADGLFFLSPNQNSCDDSVSRAVHEALLPAAAAAEEEDVSQSHCFFSWNNGRVFITGFSYNDL